MIMCVCIQLFALEHYWWISTRSYMTALLTSNLTMSDYHLFIYLKNWLQSQRFNSNEEMTAGFKTWLTSQVADLTWEYKNFFSDMTSVSMRCSLCTHFFGYTIFISLFDLTANMKVFSEYSSYAGIRIHTHR